MLVLQQHNTTNVKRQCNPISSQNLLEINVRAIVKLNLIIILTEPQNLQFLSSSEQVANNWVTSKASGSLPFGPLEIVYKSYSITSFSHNRF